MMQIGGVENKVWVWTLRIGPREDEDWLGEMFPCLHVGDRFLVTL